MTVYYGSEYRTHTGVLEAVTPEGFIVSSLSNDVEETAFYPYGSIARILQGSTPKPTPGGWSSSRTMDGEEGFGDLPR